MTLNELIAGIYTASGEVPDLEYRDAFLATDITTANWAELVRLVNEAQNALATWVHQDGRRMRMRLAEEDARLTCLRETGTIDTVTGGALTLTTGSGVRDYYRGWLVESASGVTAMVFASYDSGGFDVLVTTEASGIFAPGETLVLSKRDYRFGDSSLLVGGFPAGTIWTDYTYGTPLEITGIVGSDATVLQLEDASEKLTVRTPTAGKPGSYSKSFLGIRFDTFPDEDYEFVVRFMRSPRPFTINDGLVECELPAQFHRSVILYAFWWLLMRSHEMDKAYAVRRNLEDMLKRTQTEFDLQDRVQRGQIKLNMEG